MGRTLRVVLEKLNALGPPPQVETDQAPVISLLVYSPYTTVVYLA